MKRLIEVIKESIIQEGGNAVKSNPIPALIAPKVYDEIEKKVDSEENFKDSVEETKVESSNDNTNKTDGKDVCISVEVAK